MRRYFLIFCLGDLGFMIEREKSQVGLIISISWFYLFKQREEKEKEKKSRFGTLIFVSMELLYEILVRKV